MAAQPRASSSDGQDRRAVNKTGAAADAAALAPIDHDRRLD